MALHRKVTGASANDDTELNPIFSSRGESSHAPRHVLPDRELDPDVAYQIVRDELMLDGNSRLNLATFVGTWMEPQAQKLMAETFDKNMIDKDEYPRTAEIEMRCVNMLSRLWNSPDHEEATGTSTTGSSEAAMLGGMALKWRWRDRMRAQGKPTEKPNMGMGSNVPGCWEKFCRYWDVEARLVPVSADATHLTAERALAHCDEHTIGVVAVLGSTYDGAYEPVAEIAAALDDLQERTGLNVPVHVDGASGAMVAPFLDPDLLWDFRLDRVRSINASGHKYGLVYPGVGWVVWRDAADLPEDLVFKVNYLGGEMPTFALNFSRPGAQVVAQYYMLLRLGFEGYRAVQQESRDTAMWLAGEIAGLGPFELVSSGGASPVFAFRLREPSDFSVFDVSDVLLRRGWVVPAYTMPPDIEEMAVLRVVVRNGFSRDLASLFLSHLQAALDHLGGASAGAEPNESFHH